MDFELSTFRILSYELVPLKILRFPITHRHIGKFGIYFDLNPRDFDDRSIYNNKNQTLLETIGRLIGFLLLIIYYFKLVILCFSCIICSARIGKKYRHDLKMLISRMKISRKNLRANTDYDIIYKVNNICRFNLVLKVQNYPLNANLL